MVLQQLRDILKKKGITVYILPRTDEHQSEYLAEEDQRVAHISGFTGSNGIALISESESLVWTDGRYFLQAVKEFKEGWKLMKLQRGQPQWFQHVKSNYSPENTVVAMDARLITADEGVRFKGFLESSGFKVLFMQTNLVDEVWQRPKSHADIFVHESWSAKPANQKIAWVQDNIKQKNANGALFSDLSQICWILNVRSAEIPYNPFMKSILLVRPQGQQHTLYLPETHPNLKDTPKQVDAHLKSINVELKSYPYLPLPDKLLYQQDSLNYHLFSALTTPIDWKGIRFYRAPREEKQRQGFRQCHIRDGVAMAKFWAWRSELDSIGEFAAAQRLDNLRKEQKHNMGLSFDTISAGGPNAAVIHYTPKKEPDFIVTKDMIHLVDSGGQYLDGTTDVTRTFHFGKPTDQERDAYTRVLLGNLDIERLRWPKNSGLNGAHIDILARRYLWQRHLDYNHGTGHGVGYFEGVHEAPVCIGKYEECVYEPGMVVSNQPGFYKEGSFGIRIENLIMCAEEGDWYKFECLTVCPYDKNLLDLKLLSKNDADYINQYHEWCWNTLSPLLEGDEKAKNWLRQATTPI